MYIHFLNSSTGNTLGTDGFKMGMNSSEDFIIYSEEGNENFFHFDDGTEDLTLGTTSGETYIQSGVLMITKPGSTCKLEIGTAANDNDYAYIDLVGDTTYTDYGARFIRGNTGENTWTEILHRGTGDLIFTAAEAAKMVFKTTWNDRMSISAAGEIFFDDIDSATGTHLLKWNNSTKEVTYTWSSRKSKKNIKTPPKESIANTILDLQPKLFDLRTDKDHHNSSQLGLIAEEVAEVNPQFAIYGADISRDEYGNMLKDEEGKDILDSEELVPVDINDRAVISALILKVQQLESRIKHMENK